LTGTAYHRILGVHPGATEKQIKAAYRKLALKYHPDLNPSPDARERFQEINAAYEYLLEHGSGRAGDQGSREEAMAREIYRRDRERMQRQARARQAKKQREEEMFNRPEWHDPILTIKYLIHGTALLMAVAAVIGPPLIAILGHHPESLVETFFFIIAGIILLAFIYDKRSKWFRLGKFKTTWKDVAAYVKPGQEKPSKDRCCYRSNAMAGGKPYRIELLKIMDVKTRFYGVLDHGAEYRNRVRKVMIPRSAKAHFFHKISTLVKLSTILGFMFFFPVDSLIWRFIASLLAGGLLSAAVLAAARVRSKVTYLATPGLILKSGIWIFALAMISSVGPGFNISLSGYVYLVVAGMLFLLDMVFDLFAGFLPFYRWFFRPLIRQGRVMDALYRDGYQNYLELPVLSVLFPLFRWLF
jgi:hypothetical protein